MADLIARIIMTNPVRAELDALQAERTERVMVPTNPTPEMCSVIEEYFRKWQRILPDISDDDVKADAWNALQVYHNMLAARPKENAYVQEYLRISRADHYTREAIAASLLHALEQVTDSLDSVRPLLPTDADLAAQKVVANARAIIAGVRVAK